MGHTKDWIEGKIGEVQDKLEKQAVVNAQVAVKQAKLEIQILAQQQKIILDEEAQKALAFLFNQQCQRNIPYKFIQKALTGRLPSLVIKPTAGFLPNASRLNTDRILRRVGTRRRWASPWLRSNTSQVLNVN
jgi:hypothetical protein